jgi:hypothetical protein
MMIRRTNFWVYLIRRHWLTFGFVLGFITDLILLNRIDDLVDNLILLFYVLLATTAMLLLYVGVAERAPRFMSGWLKKYSPILMQYAFGGLLSGMLIFYGRSGDWLASAPFLLLILGVILGNEFVGKRSDRLVYNLALYFIGLFSYIVLVVPVITGMMGDWIFVLSGLLALVVVTVVVKALSAIIPNFMYVNHKRVIVTIGFIYITFNTLYFSSLIPPIPLSLTDLEIAHRVERIEGVGYEVTKPVQPWYRHLPFFKPVINPTANSVACFARVYAPTRLETDIFHTWEYQDETGHWQEFFRFGYPIAGTNEGGYGGDTVNRDWFDGVWRCSVETERGQVLGREIIVIDSTDDKTGIETEIR